jgi:hypothetical protein
MKTQAFIFLISSIVCFQADAIRVVYCEKQDADYIANKLASNALIEANEVEKVFPRGSLKYSEFCDLRNEIIMDGLAFTLYKPESNEHKFISVYNGIDGSSKTYGPFKY